MLRQDNSSLGASARTCDPVTLEIVRGAIRAAQAEMEALIERTAISAFIREKKDFYTGLFDANGVMAVGSMVPVFGDMVGPVIKHFPLETMKPGDLYVSDVFHQTWVALDELGTEAAAATGAVMKLTSMATGPVTDVKVDHPFLFFVRGKNRILFAGRVVEPKQ